MKKILSFLAAGALALGLIGCSGDLHDDEFNPIDTSKFETFELCGAMTDWKNDAGTNLKFTPTENAYEYSVTFTAKDAEQGFCFITKTGLWDDYQIGGESMKAGTLPEGISFSSKAGEGKHEDAIFSGLTKDAAYKMTVETSSGVYVVSLASTEAPVAPADPVPYYFDGLYLVGGCFKIGDMTNLWSFGSANLIYGASLDKKTGNVTYKKDIVATAESGEMGINDSSWGNKQNGKGITVNANADDYTELNGTEGSNFKVSGLRVGKAYRVEIKTTPDKDVLIKIYEIASVTFKFEVTGLSEGNLAWIGGNFWGSSWDNGWPIGAWNKPVGYNLSVSDNGVADENGVAAFNDKWNVSTVAKPGEKLSYNFKVIATDTDWSGDPSKQTGDLSVDINIDEDATYKISINIEDEEIKVTKL